MPPSGRRPAVQQQTAAGTIGGSLLHRARVPVVTFTIELEREVDERWIAEIPELSGVLCYGATETEAIAKVQALALRVLAERLEHQEAPGELLNVTFQAA
jgi:predicted RNase H-like HicB family nuclease